MLPKGKERLQPTCSSLTLIFIDLKGVLEERILDTKIEFILREALGIAKKDFYELIIDIIKRKRQMIVETMIARAMDSCMTEDEEEEIGQVFALM